MTSNLLFKKVKKKFLDDRFGMQEHALQENKEKEVPAQPLTHPNVVKSGGYTPCRMDYIIDRKDVMTKNYTNRSRKRSEKAKNESMSRSYQKGKGQGKVHRKKAGKGYTKRFCIKKEIKEIVWIFLRIIKRLFYIVWGALGIVLSIQSLVWRILNISEKASSFLEVILCMLILSTSH